ncbi:MAG TPA: Hsp20/alpha crystallin family protein [Thiolinea sp.]|nr:Hsp20/alpha crystallin family protein [Thiolinea sp.]
MNRDQPMPIRDPNQMWAEACALLAEAERLQRQFFRPVPKASAPTWEPPVDMLETASSLQITVALPGVAPERLEVHLAGGQLIVSGLRPLPVQRQGVRVHRLELPHGRFERRIPLPAGHYELAGHGLIHGCLQLNLRKIRGNP